MVNPAAPTSIAQLANMSDTTAAISAGYAGRTHFVDEPDTQPGDPTVPEFDPDSEPHK